MPFANLIGNERIKKLLKRAIAEGRISQGLLFAGPRGIGKHKFALALAQALNCYRPVEGDSCGVCNSCRKILAQEHPDVETIVSDGQFIRIAQTRALSEKAQYRPFEGRRRVYILDDADRLRLEAANSILKTLEEPPDSTVLILVTSRPYALLDTIRSRCQMLNFGALSNEELESELVKNGERGRDEAALLARLAQGSIGRALEIDLESYKQTRKVIVEVLELFATGRDTVRLLNAAEYLGRKLEREDFEAHLDALMVLLEDVLYIKELGQADTLTNADLSERLTRISENLSFEQISLLADSVEKIREGLLRNVNRQLVMESMLVTGKGMVSSEF
ncbi:MAG TPA: DNA polymerase III subunit delta' [Blastocatellia bacterium]|nr:DNA polymerase III subunit delta' [Blastocatellia bacterium]